MNPSGSSIEKPQPLLARLQEVLRPAIIEVLVDALLGHSSAMLSSPRRPAITIRTFSSAEYCRRVARRMSRTAFSASSECVSAFDLISAPFVVKMSQKTSLPQSPQTVQLVLTGNTHAFRAAHASSGRMRRELDVAARLLHMAPLSLDFQTPARIHSNVQSHRVARER